MIVFPFLGEGFANTPPTFFILCEVQTRYLKTLKYSGQYNTIYQIPRQEFEFILNMMLFLIFLALPRAT